MGEVEKSYQWARVEVIKKKKKKKRTITTITKGLGIYKLSFTVLKTSFLKSTPTAHYNFHGHHATFSSRGFRVQEKFTAPSLARSHCVIAYHETILTILRTRSSSLFFLTLAIAAN